MKLEELFIREDATILETMKQLDETDLLMLLGLINRLLEKK